MPRLNGNDSAAQAEAQGDASGTTGETIVLAVEVAFGYMSATAIEAVVAGNWLWPAMAMRAAMRAWRCQSAHSKHCQPQTWLHL